MAAPKYRLRREFAGRKKVVVHQGRAYLIDNNFFANHKNANEIIENCAEAANVFETLDGNAVAVRSAQPKTEEPKEAPKKKPGRKPRAKKEATYKDRK